jgi:DNA ligase-1
LAWIKRKKALATLDVVVVAVEAGHGKRAGWLSDYTFAVRGEGGELLTIGKAYTGLTDLEIEEMTAHFQKIGVRQRGRKLEVRPEVVLEVAFDAIHPSDRHASGLALRFPRIKRLRPDKSVEEIDTLATARELVEQNSVEKTSAAAAL